MKKLYGVGVGPGDPELMTIKAINAIKAADIICYVGKSEDTSAAFNIAKKALPEIKDKKRLCIDFPMTKDNHILEEAHSKITSEILNLLENNTVALLTLGDPAIYATYSYIAERLQKENVEIINVAGITSFSAIAAGLNIPLTLGNEELHVIPSSYSFEEAFKLKGTLVFMKSARNYAKLALYIKENLGNAQVYMVENCGMEDERVFVGAENLPESSGYFTTIIIRGLK